MIDRHHYRSELFARIYFWPFVNMNDGPDGCWHWTGARSRNTPDKFWRTYGIIRPCGEEYPAHRFSLELKLGEPLGERWALHSCDNPSCCNPAHLRPGTAKDNSDDKIMRGRHRAKKVEMCSGCYLSMGICACYECAAKAIGPGGMDDPEVIRLSALLDAGMKRQKEVALDAERLEEQYLDLADEYVSNLLSIPCPKRPMLGPLLHQEMKEDEEAIAYVENWRQVREASGTCAGRGHFARGEETGGGPMGPIVREPPLSVQCGGCGAPLGEACAGTAEPSETASPSDATPRMTWAELVALTVAPISEAHRAMILAALRAGRKLAAAARSVGRTVGDVREDAYVQGWTAELDAAKKDGSTK